MLLVLLHAVYGGFFTVKAHPVWEGISIWIWGQPHTVFTQLVALNPCYHLKWSLIFSSHICFISSRWEPGKNLTSTLFLIKPSQTGWHQWTRKLSCPAIETCWRHRSKEPRRPRKRHQTVPKVHLIDKLSFHPYHNTQICIQVSFVCFNNVDFCFSYVPPRHSSPLEIFSDQNVIVPLLWENVAVQGPEFPLLRPASCSYNNNTVLSLLFVYSANPFYLGQHPSLLANALTFSESLWKPFLNPVLVEARQCTSF